jgi:hypothetical protein
MAVVEFSWAQLGEPAPPVVVEFSWVQLGDTPAIVTPSAPTGIVGEPASGSTATISFTDNSGATAHHRIQVREVGGTWADATGDTNPVPPGNSTFAATGLAPATNMEVQVRAERYGANSIYVAGSPWWQDNVASGGAVIPGAPTDTDAPGLSGVIAITGLSSTGYTATCPAGSDAFGVTAYQWRLGGAGAWTEIAGGGRSVVFTGRTPASTDLLEMRCRDAAGNFSPALSASVTLLGIAPAVTSQPSSQSVVAGLPATFTAAFSGTPAPTIQWTRNGAPISGATGASYTLTSTLGDSGAIFTATATNSAGAVTTNAVTLTVTAAAVAPSIATQPASQTVTEGQPVTFSVAATGTAPLAYQWRRNGIDIAGATQASFSFTPTQSDSGATFSVLVSNSAGEAISNGAVLLAPPNIKPWMTWAADLTPKMPDALLPSIMEALQEATRRHFTKTRAYRLNGISLGATVAGQSVYVVPLPSGVQLVGVPDARVGEEAATEIQRYAAVEIPRDTNPTPDTCIAVNGTSSVLIWPTPTVAGQAITINAAVAPDETLEGIEYLLYVEHQEAIEAAALAELYGDKTKPWSDPAMAQALNREAKTRRLMHSTQAGPRSERNRLRSNPT